MYKITYFGHELGDIEDVQICVTFESAVADVLIRLRQSGEYQVEAGCKAGSCSLRVSRRGITIASIAECDVVCFTSGNSRVHAAYVALRAGDNSPLVKLFAP